MNARIRPDFVRSARRSNAHLKTHFLPITHRSTARAITRTNVCAALKGLECTYKSICKWNQLNQSSSCLLIFSETLHLSACLRQSQRRGHARIEFQARPHAPVLLLEATAHLLLSRKNGRNLLSRKGNQVGRNTEAAPMESWKTCRHSVSARMQRSKHE